MKVSYALQQDLLLIPFLYVVVLWASPRVADVKEYCECRGPWDMSLILDGSPLEVISSMCFPVVPTPVFTVWGPRDRDLVGYSPWVSWGGTAVVTWHTFPGTTVKLPVLPPRPLPSWQPQVCSYWVLFCFKDKQICCHIPTQFTGINSFYYSYSISKSLKMQKISVVLLMSMHRLNH